MQIKGSIKLSGENWGILKKITKTIKLTGETWEAIPRSFLFWVLHRLK